MRSIKLKLILRVIYRNKLHTILNVLGLSIGLACAILIYLWVQFQISYDRFHKNGESIYRVVQDQFYTNGEVFHVSVTPTGISRIMKENIANIAQSTRYHNQPFLLNIKGNRAIEEIHLVDHDFLTMFTFPLIKGEANKVFENNHSMVISEKMAKKYFGTKDPIGEIILLEGKYPFTITGIIKDNPKNSEIWFKFLIPFEFYKEMGINTEEMGNNWIDTYVQLTPGTSAKSVDQTIEAFRKKNAPKSEVKFYLQPLKNIHLYWLWGGGPIKNVRLFSLIAILIILIAAINFTNLSTAMAGKRFKEVGVKKTLGASRNILQRQFFSETLVLSLISLFFALIIVESLLPWFNSLLESELNLNYQDFKLFGGILAITLITGVLSGTYPAIFLSSFKPIQVIKGMNSGHRSIMREVLVVFQFCLAIVLIVNTIIIKKQQDFMQKKELGINKENIIYIPIRGELHDKYSLFKEELSNEPSIKSICLSSHLPTGIWSNGGSYKWQGKPPQVDPLVTQVTVDFDYVKTFGLKMFDGKFFSDKQYLDTENIVINKTFADITGMNPIIGQVIERGDTKYKIIGVTENFNFKPVYSKIEPLAMFCFPKHHNYFFLKIISDNVQNTIKKIEKVHNQLNPDYPFEYHFLDEDYGNLYKNDERQGKLFSYFSFLAIFISCLGLFGLSSFMIAQRTKEIGIRKIHGANAFSIMALFTRYYTRWVVFSFLVAVPVAYYFGYKWLSNFEYKTIMNWWIFVLAGMIVYSIAMTTIGWQIWRTAKRKPVEALRYE